jgi:vancomycin resistance protein VanJ
MSDDDMNNKTSPKEAAAPTESLRAPIEWLFDRLDRLWKERKQRGGGIQWLLKWIRRSLVFTTAAYLTLLVLILLALEYHGEKNLTLCLLLYAPPMGWLLPIIPMAPLCLLFCPRVALAYLAAFPILLLGYMDYNWTGGRKPTGPSLKVMTNNIGQKGKTSLTPFIEAEQPDIIALQEAGRARQFTAAYPEFNVAAHGEFTLISRLPILRSGYVRDVMWHGQPAAAWFELEFEGAPLVIYNIHIPSPRDDLNKLAGRGAALGLLGFVGGRIGEVREEYQAKWDQRVAFAEALAEVIEGDQRTTLAVGDFNMPNHGVAYRRMTTRLKDAFAESGQGFGFTVPGTTRNPLSFFGPWLRLDYVMTGNGLAAANCRIEPRRASQHRAVVAEVELTGSGN